MVENSLDRAQIYAGACFASDPDCRLVDGKVDHGHSDDDINLNLGINLFAPVRIHAEVSFAIPQFPIPKSQSVHLILGTTQEIFHPPKY